MNLANYDWTMLNPGFRANFDMIRSEMRRSLINVMLAYEDLGMMESKRGSTEANIVCQIAETVLDRSPQQMLLEDRLRRFKARRRGNWDALLYSDTASGLGPVKDDGWSLNMLKACLGGKDRVGSFRDWADEAPYR